MADVDYGYGDQSTENDYGYDDAPKEEVGDKTDFGYGETMGNDNEYGYGHTATDFDYGGKTDYGYGDETAQTDYGYADNGGAEYGYGDQGTISDYGYGEGTPEQDYGYGANQNDQEYGYGDQALDYGNAAPDQGAGYDASYALPKEAEKPENKGEKKRPKRRCSVTRFSIEAEANNKPLDYGWTGEDAVASSQSTHAAEDTASGQDQQVFEQEQPREDAPYEKAEQLDMAAAGSKGYYEENIMETAVGATDTQDADGGMVALVNKEKISEGNNLYNGDDNGDDNGMLAMINKRKESHSGGDRDQDDDGGMLAMINKRQESVGGDRDQEDDGGMLALIKKKQAASNQNDVNENNDGDNDDMMAKVKLMSVGPRKGKPRRKRGSII